MANLGHYQLVDGVKAININDFPPEAWRMVSGKSEGESDVDKYYPTVAFLYRCVDVRANALSGMPWAIMSGETDVWTSEDASPPANLLPLQDLPDLLYQTEAELTLCSQAFWQQQRRANRLLMLRWLMSTTMRPVWDAQAGLTHYERRLPGKQPFNMLLDDVVWVWHRGRHETEPRTAPAAAGMKAAGVLFNMDQFIAGYFERGAVKATILGVPANTQPAERERLKSWWNRFMTGIRNSWGNAVINADAITPVVVGEGVGELSNNSLTTEKREDIATAMGVPHSLVLSNAANYATSQQDELNFYNLTIVPEARQIQRQLNKQLFEPMGLRFEFRPNEMSLYQEDEEQRSQSLQHLTSAGVPLVLAMQILGYDLPQGYTFETLQADLDEKAEAQAEQMEAQQEQADEEEPDDTARQTEMRRFRTWAKKRKNPDPAQFKSDILSDADKAAMLEGAATAQDFFTLSLPDGPITPDAYKAMLLQLDPSDDEAEQSIRAEIERRMARDVGRAFDEQLGELLPADAGDDVIRAASNRVDATSGPVREALRRNLEQAANLGVTVGLDTLEQIGYGFDWTLASADAAQWASRYSYELVRGINSTTTARLRVAVDDWFQERTTLPDLVRELQPTFGRRRAQLIAQTETTRAAHEGNVIGFEQSGVVDEVEWYSVRDERVCPICGDSPTGMHGKRLPLRGGTVYPPAHPGCRCFVRPVVRN